MRRLHALNLRLWLPVLVAALFGCFWAIESWQDFVTAESNLIAANRDFLAREMALLQREMDYQLSFGGFADAGHALAARGTNTHYAVLLAADAQGKVLHSTRLAQVGQPIEAVVAGMGSGKLHALQRSNHPSIEYDAGRRHFSPSIR